MFFEFLCICFLIINVLNGFLRHSFFEPVTYKQGQAMADKLGAHKYMECCAITQENLAETMEAAINAAVDAAFPTKKNRNIFSKLFNFKKFEY